MKGKETAMEVEFKLGAVAVERMNESYKPRKNEEKKMKRKKNQE